MCAPLTVHVPRDSRVGLLRACSSPPSWSSCLQMLLPGMPYSVLRAGYLCLRACLSVSAYGFSAFHDQVCMFVQGLRVACACYGRASVY